MIIKRWKIFTGLFAAILAATILITPAAMAKGQDGGEQRGGRLLLSTAAELMDMTPRELMEDLRSQDDRTIADVATENDVSIDTIINAVVTKVSEKLAQKVADGDMTQAEADERLAQVKEKVTEAVNSPLPENGQGNQGNRGKRGGRALLRVAADKNIDVNTIIDAVVEKAGGHFAPFPNWYIDCPYVHLRFSSRPQVWLLSSKYPHCAIFHHGVIFHHEVITSGLVGGKLAGF